MIFDKKKIIMILLFSVVLFATISATCATDLGNNGTDDVNVTDKSFDEIQFLIDNANENDTIDLNGNYISSGKQIVINKTLTINGNNATLDGNYSSRIFEVNQNNCIFNNINFINGAPLFDEDVGNGGAILFNCENGYVNNCYFKDNFAAFGGAICGGTVFNSTFINNEASFGGAIAYSNVIKSTFIDNLAYEDYGGNALFSCDAYNCIFEGEGVQWDPSESDVGNYSFIIFTEDTTVNVGEEAYIKAKVYDENGTPIAKNIKFEIDNIIYNASSNEDGIAILNCSNFTSKGDIVVGVVRVLGEGLSNEASFRVFVNKNASYIIVDNATGVYTKNVNLSATVYDGHGNIITTGNVSFEINGEEFKAVLSGNKYVYEYKNIDDAGQFIITGIFKGNDQLEGCSNTSTLDVDKLNTTLSLSVIGTYYKATKLKVVLANCNVDTVPVTLTFNNGRKVTLNLDDGVGYYYVSYVPGNYNVTVSINNELFRADSVNKPFTILKSQGAVITPTKLTTTYDSGKYFQVKVTMNGTAMAGVKIKLLVYTGNKYKTYYITTGTNGIAKLSASKLAIGTHKVIVSSDESTSSMTATKKTSYIVINKATTTVSAPKVTNKYKAKKYFKITIKNKATGKLVSGLKLKIKVYTGKKYKTYTVKTNSKGVASLSTRYIKRGTHKVVISSANSKYTVKKSGYLIKIK